MHDKIFVDKSQACGFLLSSHGHAALEERELEEFNNDDHVVTASLLEQVPLKSSIISEIFLL